MMAANTLGPIAENQRLNEIAAASQAKIPATGQGGSVAENYRLNQVGKPKTITEVTDNPDGTYTITYSDGTKETKGNKKDTAGAGAGASAGTGTDTNDEEMANRRSAYQLLLDEFSKYGLSSLVTDAKDMLINRTPSEEIPLALRNTDAYQKRFSANADRLKNGLRALSPAEYISKEDAYQNVMRQYGLPASYYTKDSMGKQAGFDKLLSADIDDVELEDRIATAQQRVLNTNPEVLKALKQFYPDLNNADILAYTLDPKQAITDIKRKVTAAEIGGAALQQGLQALGGTAEALAGQGITKAQAQQGYANVAEMTPRGSELSSIYGESPYTQGTAEAEVFNTTGAADATRKRKKLKALEEAQFSGSSGVGALGRDRATNYGTTQSGFGSY
jgi:hypothetical protein